MSFLVNLPLGYNPFDQNDDSDFGDDSIFSRDFSLLNPEPCEFISHPDDQMLRTIHKDCKLIESSGSASPSDVSETSESSFEPFKYEIRNHDCMWSGRCNDNDNLINDSLLLFNELEPNCWANYQSYAAMNLPLTTAQQKDINLNNQQNNNNNNKTSAMISPTLITPPMTNDNQLKNSVNQQHQLQNIPPGTSLLINSRLNQQKKQCNNNNKMTIPTVLTNDFLKDRETISNFNNHFNKDINRPDTPLSLDDDPPMFKHSVDLAACIMGSNNICLEQVTEADKIIIRKLKEQLEDTTTEKIDLHNILPGNNKSRSLTEVLNAIGSVENESSLCMVDSCESETEDEYDDDDDDDLLNNNHNHNINNNNNNNNSSTRQDIYPIMHSDHSYTRLKNGGLNVIGLGLETPSDSDEEIDVVSIGDKKLPTNPSDKDRRALQTRVANKISARIVKTANGIKTIPPRRRCSYDLTSNANTTKKSSNYNSISSTPGSPGSLYHNHHHHYSSSGFLSSSNGGSSTTTTTPSIKYTKNSRKRSYASNKDEYTPSSLSSSSSSSASSTFSTSSSSSSSSSSSTKRHRGKKQKLPKKHIDMDEADTIEKRNLHNNMERQRRIGLKNLFEALKRQIPNIKDKERAPKVTILREAAKMCDQQIKDEKHLHTMKQQLQLQLQRRQALLAKLKMETTEKISSSSTSSSASSIQQQQQQQTKRSKSII